ncbi:cytochrome c biogenesis protein CcdA [Helicobacter sp. 16-1353]|uniref:cytochrome c biogenesis CcdA family protein n=1 Tax=Helicobacter sp. 16-1353 TaxID=2004996 RepID=UPI00215C8954|nr:cytochrome c biogenesis protein CcdA [Helicobacter sp. 16-1353]
MELALINLFKELPYIVSFIAGILTFLSPCILPLIPPYMSYIGGISLEELKTNSLKARIYIFQRAALFVSGFSLIFILIGISFNTILSTILSNPITNYIAGGIIIIFGIHFLGIVRFNILYKTKRLELKHNKTRKEGKIGFLIHTISPFILGIGFALGWSPCVGPILSSIMVLSSTDKASGLSLMIIYAIGLSVPFLLTALAIERFFTLFNKIKKYARIIEIISGILLIIIGITIAFGGLDRLNEILI